jgi:hypothetical protein
MNNESHAPSFSPLRLNRRLVFGAALLGALIVWMPPKSTPVQAQSRSAPAAIVAEGTLDGQRFAAKVEFDTQTKPEAGKDPAVQVEPRTDTPDAAASAKGKADREPAIVIEKNGKKVTVFGIHSDAEYNSFNDLVNQEPWLGALIFFSVAMVFTVPLLLVLALIWYKMRKNRMLNETMLKLAEKGVVPPADAMDAIAGTPQRPAAANAGTALYERAREVRRSTAWSDLRKGIVMGGIGAALTLSAIINDGEANGFGLVLLFVGIGYAVLWWFEDRQAGAAKSAGGLPPSGAP